MVCDLTCEFIEPTRDTWFYIIQNWTCPSDAWDWREDATCYGPFRTYEEGKEHLKASFCDSENQNIFPFAYYQPDDTYQKLIATTVTPRKSSYTS